MMVNDHECMIIGGQTEARAQLSSTVMSGLTRALAGEVIKNITGAVKFSKKIYNFKKRVVTVSLYVVKRKWQAYSLSD